MKRDGCPVLCGDSISMWRKIHFQAAFKTDRQRSHVSVSFLRRFHSFCSFSGCRETAFIYSITSAGVAHAMARSCSEGKMYTCSCDHQLEQPQQDAKWKWGGCSDNYKFGYKFSKRFTDSIEKGEDFRYMVNKQNNEAGRRVSVARANISCLK